MNKIFAVAKAEYGIAIRSKAFIIGFLLTPLLMGGALLAQKFIGNHVDTTDRKCAIVDRSDFLYPILETANAEREKADVFELSEDGTRKQVRPRFFFEEYSETNDSNQTEIELSQRVERGELFAYLVIDKEIVDTENPAASDSHALAYHTETPTFEALPKWLRKTVNQAVLSRRFENAHVDSILVKKLSQTIRLTSLGLVKVSADGSLQEAKKDNKIVTKIIPLITMMLLFMLVMTATPTLLNQVLEEKMQKISEVLISSVSPFQLLMGKLIGTVAVTLTLSILYLASAYYVAWNSGIAGAINPSFYVWFLLLLTLALFMFGSVFSAIGAASSEIKDAQNLMTPAMLLIIIPIFFVGAVIESPNSLFATALSLFPPSTPTIMMLRIALPPGPPLWQILLSILLSGSFTILCIAVAGKIFRIGILSQGETPSYARLLKWVFSK
jgi:ABC-2 type transport system permease protein